MEWLNLIIEIASGLAIVIPLVISLVKYVKQAMQEKNWTALLDLLTRLIQEAEGKFETGTERKAWVQAMVLASANTINYDIDIAQVGELIDNLVAMSRQVNANKKED